MRRITSSRALATGFVLDVIEEDKGEEDKAQASLGSERPSMPVENNLVYHFPLDTSTATCRFISQQM
jgi:hypothetical protein